ncbi:hypothetical protein RA280_19685 [Cupriavidus sp. CV2]|uniref:hypothetical protein n=1 Tax=Cupriavidus ulmosensis TaxID=3065913 RepID=UPI00296AF2DE|nr:hypothetical protein [Cupriavidus sp. CV2]MDW3683925.1 hypothetical protein [Cupriavidus sp. CV2]
MSWEAVTWAGKQRTGRSSTKSVLTWMANCAAMPQLRAFTSVAYLVEMTELNEKTVGAAIKHLEELGLITDTGERTGSTRQVRIYQLNVDVNTEGGGDEGEGHQKRKASKNGRLPKTEQKPTKNGVKAPQKRSETPPKTGAVTEGTEKEQKGTEGGAPAKTGKEPSPFEQLWAVYPKKAAKGDAEKAYRKLGPDAELQAVLLAAGAAQAGWDSWKEEGGKFVPHLATWLNGKRWADEQPAKAVAAAGGAPAGDADDAWHTRWSGITEKGAQVFRPFREGKDDTFRYKVHVFKLAGEGKWRDDLLAELLRTKNSLYAEVHQHLYGHPPVEVGA